MTGEIELARRNVLDLFDAALQRVEGRAAVRRFMEQEPPIPCSVLAIGKAAESMCSGAHEVLGAHLVAGLLITKAGHVDHQHWRGTGVTVVEAAHPIPDASSLQAGETLIRFLAGLPADLPLLFLISGGASSLVEVLRPEVSLEDLRRANAWMLANGLSIAQINRVRRCLSRIKSGGMLDYLGDRPVRGLLISDVPGDDLAVIGSGLLVPASLGELVELPEWLTAKVAPVLTEHQPQRTSPPLQLIATLQDAIDAAADRARAFGLTVEVHEERLTGDATAIAFDLAETLRSGPTGVHIWGGETTVVLPAQPGRGGRNQHLALCLAQQLADVPGWVCLVAGTDGTDGPTEDAGGLVDGGTWQRVVDGGVDPVTAIATTDSGTALEAAGDLLHTGPTGTNVMDLAIASKWERDVDR